MLKYFYLLLPLFAGSIFSQINIESLRMEEDSTDIWSGHVESELTVKKGSSDVVLLESTVSVGADWDDRGALVIVKGDIGESNGARISNSFVAHLRYVEKVSDFLNIEAFVQYNYNLSRKLLGREIEGAGVRLRLHESELLKVRFGLGGMYESERYNITPGSEVASEDSRLRGSSYLALIFLPAHNIKITSTTYYQPAFNTINNFRMLSETKAAFKFSSDLSFAVKFNLFYDNLPLPGLKTYEIDSKYGITWEF